VRRGRDDAHAALAEDALDPQLAGDDRAYLEHQRSIYDRIVARCLALVLVTACGSTPKPAPQVKGPSTCDRVADHEISLMSASQKAPPEQLDPFRKVIAHHCTDDLWSADMQQCLLATKTIAEGDACSKYLTPQQAERLQADGQAAVENLDAGSAK
jgi:hypothetical protein